jgi:hypothetical protein
MVLRTLCIKNQPNIMDQTSEENLPNEVQRTKKVWKEPQLFIISQANVAGGINNGAHEANFTPNHTHYQTPGGDINPPTTGVTSKGAPYVGFPTTEFNNYQS